MRSAVVKGLLRAADDLGMVWFEPIRIRLSGVFLLVLLAISCSWGELRADGTPDEPELFPGRTVARCEVTERPATGKDVPLATRILVLAEPKDWLDVPGPRGERAEGWQGRHAGYRVCDGRGRLLHALPDVSVPRWSPDGRWLAVSRWSPELPYQLALVEVRSGRVIPIPQVQYLEYCAWSPDSRKLAFVGQSFPSGDHSGAGWLSVPDTSVHAVARDLNGEFECIEMAWSADSRRFVGLMHREYEHDDVRVTDLWLFGLTPGACRLTATPGVEETNVSWLDDRHVIFRIEPSGDAAQSGFGTVLELPALAKSPR
jgi:WD40 repeat protein